MQLDINIIKKEVQGKWIQEPLSSFNITGISINSKKVKKGDLFIAIKGQNFDGHHFVKEAKRKGAKAIIVSKKRGIVSNTDKTIVSIYVPDTIKALGQIARYYRDQFLIPIIAITGTAGKTTTKDMLAAILSAQYKVLNNTGTENNHIGVPLTLFKLKKSYDIAVIELGTSCLGDIPWLTYISYPTIGLITNIGEGHLEGLKNLNTVFQEKTQLFKLMTKGGKIFINRDDIYLKKIPALIKKHKIYTYGIHNLANNRATKILIKKNNRLEFIMNNKYSFRITSPSFSYVYNALGAISCARLFNVPYETIQKKLTYFRQKSARLAIMKAGYLWVINDTYNANPVSYRNALATISSFQNQGRKILICADMLELGTNSLRLHKEIGKLSASSNLNLILSYGKEARRISQEAKKYNKNIEVKHFCDLRPLHRLIEKYCHPGDCLLIKGSRAMHMERTVDFIKKTYS